MSNPSIKLTNANRTKNYIINITYNPKLRGHEVIVLRDLNGSTYNVRTVITDLTYERIPCVFVDALNRAMPALDQTVKENMIKEFNNPSFRRKDNDRENQKV